jgi:hypothetical protein
MEGIQYSALLHLLVAVVVVGKIQTLCLRVILAVLAVVARVTHLHLGLLGLVAQAILLLQLQVKEAMAVLEYGKLLTMVLAVAEVLVLLEVMVLLLQAGMAVQVQHPL